MSKKIYDIKPPEKATSKERSKTNGGQKSKSKGFVAGIVAGAVFLSAIVFFFSFRVEVDIWPSTEGVELEESFSVDIAAESMDDSLPGTIFETDFLEEYREFEATGYEDEETRATGTVIVKNEQWSQDQPLVEGTRFETEDGLVFKSKDGFMAPGGSQGNPGEVEVEVEADEPGSEYNINPTEFKLPGLEGSSSYNNVAAVSETSFTGGAIGERTVVSEEDIENARQEIIESLVSEGRNILESGKKDKHLMEEDSQYNYEIQDEEIDAQAGQAVDNFSVRIRARIDVLTFKKEDFRNLLTSRLLSGFDAPENNLESEKRVYKESLSFNYQFSEINWPDGKGTLEVEFAGEVYSDIDEARLIERAQGGSRENLKGFLERQEFVRRADIRFRPFGIGPIPENSERIRINLNF